jgi:hypothetical protein
MLYPADILPRLYDFDPPVVERKYGPLIDSAGPIKF